MRRQLKILISSSFMYNIGAGAFAPLYAIFVEKIGGGIFDASTIWAAQTVLIGILVFFLGKMVDRINKRKALVVGYFLTFIGFVGYIFVKNVPELFFVQMFLGVASAISIPAFDAFYSKQLDRGRESSEWSVWESGWRVIAASSAVVGGFIAAQINFHSLFIFMAVFAGLSAAVISQLLKKKEYIKLLEPIPKPFFDVTINRNRVESSKS